MMVFNRVRSAACVAFTLVIVALAGCTQQGNQSTERAQTNAGDGGQNGATALRIEAAPVRRDGDWQVTTGERVTLAVAAPGAREVKFLYRPVVADEEVYEIATVNAAGGDRFTTEFDVAFDLAGEVSAEIAYQDGATRESERLALVAPFAAQQISGGNEAATSESAGGNNEAAREMRAGDGNFRALNTSGGTVEHNRLREGDGDIRIAINIPAFRMTLWQGDRPVKSYEIGIGKKSHPLPPGDRQTTQVIFNPHWVPPNSAWVRRMRGVSPGERITAADSRNPLGNIKIPLGSAYLIHEAAADSDIGSLVSHGCARVLQDDLFDLANNLLVARGKGLNGQQLAELRRSSERRIENFDTPVPVVISYDTQTIENGTLYLYPDVYDRDTNTVERLRELLQANGVDANQLDDAKLRELLERPNANERFVVTLDDVRRGRTLEQGRSEPLTVQSARREERR